MPQELAANERFAHPRFEAPLILKTAMHRPACAVASAGGAGQPRGQAPPFQAGGTIRPRPCAMTSITTPVVVHSTSASTEDSTPNAPPVR